MALSTKLKEYREANGLKQADLAELVGVRRETIVNLDEVGRLLTYGGNNYDFVSIRVVGTLKDEFKKPAVPR